MGASPASALEAFFAQPPLITAEPFETLAPEWASLHAATPEAPPFAHPRWHETWLRHFGSGIEPVFVAVRREEALLGVVPLAIAGPDARVLGDPDLCDYAGVLALPGEELTVAAGLLEWLREDLTASLDLWGVPAGGPLHDALAEAGGAFGWTVDEAPEAVAPAVALAGDWEAYLAGLKKKHRHELRRKVRNLEAAGEVAFTSATAPAEVASGVETLLTMMRASREDKEAFLTPPTEAFFRDMTAALSEHGLVRLSTLALDGHAIATVLTFETAETAMLYNSGFDPAYGHLAAGLVSKAFVVRDAIARGLRRVDFLRGDEDYKRHLGGAPCAIVAMRLTGM